MSDNIIEAVREAMRKQLEEDDDTVLLGQDIGVNDGVFRATEGLQKEFGEERVIDTPLAEEAIVGTSFGMAMTGKIPVAEIQFMGFIYPAFDQIISHLGRIRTRSNNNLDCQVTIRAPYGGGIHAPEHHSESTEAIMAHTPGLKVVIPSKPDDAKKLLEKSIQSKDPVIFLEPKRIYRSKEYGGLNESNEFEIGKAEVRSQGTDITVYSWGSMAERAERAVMELDYDIEFVDIRTVKPLDKKQILKSFRKTGKAIIIQESPLTCSVASEIATTIQEKALIHMEAPIRRVSGLDTPYPLYRNEQNYLPTKKKIKKEIRKTIEFNF